jgi:hypothetical protein
MSIIKFGNINILDWDYFSKRDRILLRNSNEGFTVVLIVDDDFDDIWHICFYDKLQFLNNIIPDKCLVGTEDDIKKQVDDFLIRMNKLKAFL